MFHLQKFSEEFISVATKEKRKETKNGVLCKNPQLKPEVLSDGYDRLVGVQVNLCGVKTLVLGIYATNEGKVVFYKQFM